MALNAFWGQQTGLHPGSRGGQRVLCYPVQG